MMTKEQAARQAHLMTVEGIEAEVVEGTYGSHWIIVQDTVHCSSGARRWTEQQPLKLFTVQACEQYRMDLQ